MRNRRAITLIEMLVVIVLVSILTAMSLPRLNDTAYRVDAGARAVRSALQRAATYAVSSQHNMLVAVDANKGELYVVEDANNNLVADPGERVIAVPMQDGVKFTTPANSWPGVGAPSGPISGSALTTIIVNGISLPGFVFRCDGAASTDVQIYLTSKRGRINDNRGVNVTQATGRADWYKNLGGTWMLGGF
jgi:prepilin-type N-terminal cleavage/methylation domain-containing protein